MKNKEITIYELMGLIKDGKAPKKICYQGNYLEFDGEDYEYYEDADVTSDDSLVKYIAVGNLKDTVEILPEENDEWTDIEEYYPGDGMAFNISTYEYKINQLIKNQKYLKEKLDGKND